jgi:hypothetical protein
MLAPMDGGAGATLSACGSCPKDCVAEISTGVATSTMTAISSRDSLKFIGLDSFDYA